MSIYVYGGEPPHFDGLTDDWESALRWMISVMDDGDPSMSFVAGCLSYVSKPTMDGSLTERQERGCEKVLARLQADYENLQLDCLHGGVGNDA